MSAIDKGFVVLAEFKVREGQRDAFLALAYNDANESLANESGCHQFDVLVPEENGNTVVFHEVYTDRAAFEKHTTMPHYQPFKDGTAPLLEEAPKVRFFHPAARPQN
ncbi:Quinol monooxygenase YgiN [Kushneria avicenniae]|uniref:Quinol monooxygenase YgiN n=1 Tax=Kushneria avicenniae TaxID=402385 RepID=A0A1I1KKD0_9GAMM|nr:putative quinol monooxygenase [Kushneria avicenniae]SFC61257.1 Quinol monooxygenase YgiN [Kushneria avicenniae]